MKSSFASPVSTPFFYSKNRKNTLKQLKTKDPWDLVIIGGGSVGSGILLDAALRGLRVLLLEGQDYAEGTSSRSSKLLHGGVRYLAQGQISLIREALRERSIAITNAPHLSRKMEFIIPCNNKITSWYYAAGMKLYDALAGKFSLGKSAIVNRKTFAEKLAALKQTGSAVKYYDGQFDDARFIQSILSTAKQNGGYCLNYCPVTSIDDQKDSVELEFFDRIENKHGKIQAKAIVHATGVWNDKLLAESQLNGVTTTISRGAHIVVRDLGLQSAVLIPKTNDGRVLFIIPWQGQTLIGTTDKESKQVEFTPYPATEEITWILETANSVLSTRLTTKDIQSIFCGYRPLVTPGGQKEKNKSSGKISREHYIDQPSTHSLRVIGGKWTTYRSMAEEVVDLAVEKKIIKTGKKCQTKAFALLAHPVLDNSDKNFPAFNKTQLKKLVVSACEDEDATTIDDIISRRLQLSFYNYLQAAKLAPKIAAIMAEKCGWDAQQQQQAVADFLEKTRQYNPQESLKISE